MKIPSMIARIVAACLLAVAVTGCSPGKEEQKPSEDVLSEAQEGPRGSGPLGCCQEGPDSCSAPAYKSECTQTDGVFHEGKACDIKSGKCGDDL